MDARPEGERGVQVLWIAGGTAEGERALAVRRRLLDFTAGERDPAADQPAVELRPAGCAAVGAVDEPVGQRGGRLPVARPVELVDALRVEVLQPGGVAEALGEPLPFAVELRSTAEVAEVGRHAAEIEVPADALRRVRRLGDLDALCDVVEPASVAHGRPGHADPVEGIGTEVVQAQLVGDRHRGPRGLERRLGLVGADAQPGERAEDVRLRV